MRRGWLGGRPGERAAARAGGRAGQHGDGPVEVVLLEEDAAADHVTPRPVASGSSARGRRSRARSALRRWGGVVVVLALAPTLSDAVADRRERADLARYADVPGVVASLRDPVVERWRMPVLDPVWAAAGVLVSSGTDGRDVVARDAATGEVRWSQPLPDGVVPPVRCPLETGDPGDPPALVCFAAAVVPSESRTVPAVVASRVAAVDAADGTLRHVLTVRALRGSVAVDGDVVLVELAEAGLVVTRHDLVRGEQVWRSELPDVVPGPDGVGLHAAGGLVVVEARTTTVLAADDGHEVGRWVPGTDPAGLWTARVVVRPGEGYGVWTSPASGRWYGPDGSGGPELAGLPADPAVHDASTPGVVLLRSPDDGSLRAVEASTGRRRWERPAPARVLVRLAGRVVVTGGGRMEGLDTATGRTLWTVPLPDDRPDAGEVLTDGLRVAIQGPVDGRPGLTAYSLSTGDRLWQVPVPGGASTVAVLGGRLTAVSPVRTSGDGRPELIVLG
ncbi:outer membrane protein assembly factor BamB family protein [Cellulomonas aerilata]|uniref:Pyrrolo-quinoline quinone repeat domain-containing protein n=1 Tax=Cellulomonas aerilata TaxID=515326 RepID=A0A512DC13_9CELL|nr:PQQ-binding-like beta-propeller repeat protein [Cellulomonas aerilata]GEO34003.1 hypothetical protein CAE01nite_17280 [Cellulomonas aerilata]